jgi:hypothetical protein
MDMLKNTLIAFALLTTPSALFAGSPAVVHLPVRPHVSVPVIGPAPIVRNGRIPMIFPGPTPIVRGVQLPGAHPLPVLPKVVVAPVVTLPTIPAHEASHRQDDRPMEERLKKIFENMGKNLQKPVVEAAPAKRVHVEEDDLLKEIGSN